MKELELEVTRQLPVIRTNFEDVRKSLTDKVKKYKGIIVTEENLKDCKAAQIELASMRNTIENFRKSVKKDMEIPIKLFEGECKGLTSLVSEVEEPIKEGITIFDNKRREEKRIKALEFIKESIEAHQLNEKYASRLNVLDKYLNLTASVKSVKEDIEQRALTLVQDQEKELGLTQIIKGTIKAVNETIKTQLRIEDFKALIDMNCSTVKIIEEIHKRAEIVRNAEKVGTEETNKEELKPVESGSIPEDTNIHTQPINKHEQLFFYDLRVVANKENMIKLSELLKSDGFEYIIKDKGKV